MINFIKLKVKTNKNLGNVVDLNKTNYKISIGENGTAAVTFDKVRPNFEKTLFTVTNGVYGFSNFPGHTNINVNTTNVNTVRSMLSEMLFDFVIPPVSDAPIVTLITTSTPTVISPNISPKFVASATTGSTTSHCKITATDKGVLNAFRKCLRITDSKCSGKFKNTLFAGMEFNRINLNIEDNMEIFKELTHTEMMYGIKLNVSVASVSEFQAMHPDANVSAFFEVNVTYLWVTTQLERK